MTQDDIDREIHDEGNCEDGCSYCAKEGEGKNIFHKVGCECKECKKNFAEHKYSELIDN